MKYKHFFISSLILVLVAIIFYFLLRDKAIIEQKNYQWLGVFIPQIACYVLSIGVFKKLIKNTSPFDSLWVLLATIWFILAIIMIGISFITLLDQPELIDYPWQMWVWVGYWLAFVIIERVMARLDNKIKIIT